MEKENSRKLIEERSYKIVKANRLIQESRFNLSLQEQKIILYLISKIKPDQMYFDEHEFEIQEFCKICGIDHTNGGNYEYVKKTLKDLRDKSLWVQEGKSEILLAWIDTVVITKDSGTVKIAINDRMKPYLLQLQEQFTSYELYYILAMRSQYSVRLYELLKSYEYKKGVIIAIEDFKRSMMVEKYGRFPDLRRYVIEPAIKEINSVSDINVTWEPLKQGRKYNRLKFVVTGKKNISERAATWERIENILNPAQQSLFDEETIS